MTSNHQTISLGILGQYYSARHALGQYRSACVVASYSVLDDLDPSSPARRCLQFALERSLQATIRQHPGLRYGVSDETNAGVPQFRQLDYINRSDVFEVIESPHIMKSPETEEIMADTALSGVLGEAHARLWQNNKPAWRVIVIEHMQNLQGQDSNHVSLTRLDIVFLAHHAMADGLSGISFHQSLMEAFQGMPDLTYPPTWPMILTAARDAPAAVEERVNCLPCTCTICTAPSTCKGPVWAGNSISPTPLSNFKSMVRIVSIPAENLSDVLKRCKLSNITLTGFLHALICTSLCRGIKGIPGIRAVTPFSLRKQTGAAERDIVNHISFLATYIPGKDLSKLEKGEYGSAAEEQDIIQLARSFSSDISTRVKQFPHGSMFTHLNRVNDLLSLCSSQASTERLYTYELSNLGSAAGTPTRTSNRLKMEKLVFTQCGMVAGPAIGFNCASVRGGSFTISITWQRGVVKESLVEHLAKDLERRLNHGVDTS